jgi:GNAT superfamily N-acetyltransferase
MQTLPANAYDKAQEMTEALPCHTVLRTILSGETPGRIYADDPKNPRWFFAQFRHRAFISGEPDPTVQEELRTFILKEVFANCRAFKVPLFRLSPDASAWMPILKAALHDHAPIISPYHCYRLALTGSPVPVGLPTGFSLRQVNADLMETDFEGKDDLAEEMCSERESVTAFLEKSFGLAAFADGRLAGWCLSEYNTPTRCEVGIATLPPHRRKGLAAAMTRAFINQALEKGLSEILWHCYPSNTGSVRTALNCGFALASDEEILELYLDPAIHLGVHGNLCFEKQDDTAALEWYSRALSKPEPESWIAWNAACAAARAGQADHAYDFLNQAVDLGFNDLDYLVQSPRLESLKGDPRWATLITRLNRQLPS